MDQHVIGLLGNIYIISKEALWSAQTCVTDAVSNDEARLRKTNTGMVQYVVTFRVSGRLSNAFQDTDVLNQQLVCKMGNDCRGNGMTNKWLNIDFQ